MWEWLAQIVNLTPREQVALLVVALILNLFIWVGTRKTR